MTIRNMNEVRILDYRQKKSMFMNINDMQKAELALIVHIQHPTLLLILIISWMQGHCTHVNSLISFISISQLMTRMTLWWLCFTFPAADLAYFYREDFNGRNAISRVSWSVTAGHFIPRIHNEQTRKKNREPRKSRQFERKSTESTVRDFTCFLKAYRPNPSLKIALNYPLLSFFPSLHTSHVGFSIYFSHVFLFSCKLTGLNTVCQPDLASSLL